ncbi:MAG: division/cell wall cluster transcriptional repressor MraZ [Oscillospiraceae bacterium]|nr:division/cell wall cluster transcriptional repressor MraZ [Oscillospiraceae bacterium]
MTGEYQHTLDSKGRIFLPARLREELGSTFYVTLSPEKCLSAYSSESWQELTKKVNALPFIRQRRMRPIFANAAKCELDSQGRVLIPQNLRNSVGLAKDIIIVGCNNHVEFWDSENWRVVYDAETTPENIAAVMEELEF